MSGVKPMKLPLMPYVCAAGGDVLVSHRVWLFVCVWAPKEGSHQWGCVGQHLKDARPPDVSRALFCAAWLVVLLSRFPVPDPSSSLSLRCTWVALAFADTANKASQRRIPLFGWLRRVFDEAGRAVGRRGHPVACIDRTASNVDAIEVFFFE